MGAALGGDGGADCKSADVSVGADIDPMGALHFHCLARNDRTTSGLV